MNEVVLAYIEKTGHRDPEKIRGALKNRTPVPMAEIRSTLAQLSGVKPPDLTRRQVPQKLTQPAILASTPKPLRGISLVNIRVSDRKPNEGIKAQLYSLPKDRAFVLEDLVREWCLSAETIKTQAKRFDALKYVEIEPGRWVLCVMHPDTAATITK